MAIEQITYKRKHPSARYDPAKKAWVAYRVDVVAGGTRHRPVFPTKREAERFVEQVKVNASYKRAGLKVDNGRHAPRVSELLDKRLSSLTKKAEQVRARRVFAYFQRLLPDDMRLTDVRRSHFQQYVNERLTTGVKPETVTREMAMLSAAFRAVPELFPDLDDFQPPKVARPKTKRGHKTKRTVTEDEMRAVADRLYKGDAFSQRVARMWVIAWYLGLRYSEVLKLRKKDLNRRQRTLGVTRWKTGDFTVFESLPDELLDTVTAAAKASGDPEHLFPHKWAYPNEFYDVLRPAIESAGMPYGRERPEQVSFHSLRHSFVSRAIELADLRTVGQLSAHSDTHMIMHYSHSSPGKQRRLLEQMYGQKDEERLREIYDKVRAGTLDFDAFLEALKVG